MSLNNILTMGNKIKQFCILLILFNITLLGCSIEGCSKHNSIQKHIFDDEGNLKKIKTYKGDSLIKLTTYDEVGKIKEVQRSFLIRQTDNKSYYHVVLNMEEIWGSEILHFGTHKVNVPITFELCAIKKTGYPKPNYCEFRLYYNTKDFEREIQAHIRNVHSLYELRDTLVDVIDGKDSLMEFVEKDSRGVSTAFGYMFFFPHDKNSKIEDMHAILNSVNIINDFCIKYTITPLEAEAFYFYPIFYCRSNENPDEIPSWSYFPNIPPPTAQYKFEVIE
jgi:hypothetical protein